MKKILILTLLTTITILTTLAAANQDPILTIDTGGHKAVIKDVIFTNDGRYLVSASNDKTIRVWDLKTGKINRIIRGEIGQGHEGKIFAAALSNDNEWLAVGGFMAHGHGIDDDKVGNIRLYHFPTNRLIGLLKGHTNVVFSLAFSPNNRLLASGDGVNTVRVWDITTQKQIHKLSGHTAHIHALSWFPDNRRLISGSDDHTLILWNTETGTKIKTLSGHQDDVSSVAVSPNGKYIASGSWDKTVHLWSAKNGAFIKILAEQETRVVSLSFAPDSQSVLTGTSGRGSDICHLYAVPSGRNRIAFTKHDNIVLATAISPDGQWAATGGGDNQDIYLWSTTSGKVKHKLSGRGQKASGALVLDGTGLLLPGGMYLNHLIKII